MHGFWGILGVLLGAVWLHQLLDTAIGMPKVPEISQPHWEPPKERSWPRVSIIVPARNEEEHVEAAVGSLLALDYPGYEVIAVNDRSSDRTGEILDRLARENPARLRVLHVRDLPGGWMGKPHAMGLASQQATGDWLLFTDADVTFRPDALRRALHYAQESQADHLVLAPTIHMHSVGERMMIALFQILFHFGHRPWKVADRAAKDYVGIGAFNLVRRSVYEALGAREALRMDVLDDMKLGKLVKEKGYAQHMAFGRDLITLRWARGAMGVVENLTKNLFAVLGYRWPRALGATFLLLFLNLGPFLGVLLVPSWTRLGYILALGAVALMYAGMSWYLPISPIYFLLHPVGTMFFAYAALRSMFLTLRQGGVVWRGTKYPLEELRKGLV